VLGPVRRDRKCSFLERFLEKREKASKDRGDLQSFVETKNHLPFSDSSPLAHLGLRAELFRGLTNGFQG
jgi:hypothetical protein